MHQPEFVRHHNIPILGLSYHNLEPREAHLPLQCYHTLRITYVQQGSGIWSIGHTRFQIAPGDIFIFNNSEYRAIRTIYPPDNLMLTVIDFEPRLLWSNQQDIYDSNDLRLFFGRERIEFENRIPGDMAVSAQVKVVIDEMEKELAAKLPEYQQMLKVKLLHMLVILNRHFSMSAHLEHNANREFRMSMEQFSQISQIMKYIDTHLDTDLSREHLADSVHIHPSNLSKLFKKWNGIGLSQYITRKRVYASVQLLSQSHLSVLDIALRCGFNNTANYYKAFKSVTGGIPSDYRPKKT